MGGRFVLGGLRARTRARGRGRRGVARACARVGATRRGGRSLARPAVGLTLDLQDGNGARFELRVEVLPGGAPQRLTFGR